VLSGPATLQLRVPLERLPLYVRANALIPTMEPQPYLREEPFTEITVMAYLLERGAFTLHDLDGTTRIAAALSADGRLLIELTGAKRRLSLRLIPLAGQPTVRVVSVNGGQLCREVALPSPEEPAPRALPEGNTWARLPAGGCW
jgi:alpha-D-xyloside xylohydrolase